MPVPDETTLIRELRIIRGMCCKEHMIEEINLLIDKVAMPVERR